MMIIGKIVYLFLVEVATHTAEIDHQTTQEVVDTLLQHQRKKLLAQAIGISVL